MQTDKDEDVNSTDNKDRVTIGLYRVQNGESFKPLTSDDIEKIKTIANEFTAAARKASRTKPEIVLSVLLVPDWQHGSSYEDNIYKKAQENLLKEISSIPIKDDVNFKVEDFYSKANLETAEKDYLNGLEALGSNADMIKTHAIIRPENRNRRHLQLDTNTKIFSYDALYNNTFNAAEQKDALNASFYDKHYVSAHNKIVYTTPGGKIAPALQEVHLEYCDAHKDDHKNKSTETEKKIINGDSKNSIYSKDFTMALSKIGLTEYKAIDNDGRNKIIYPAVLEEPEYRITKHVLTAVNMTWKPISEAEKIMKEYNDKLNQLPGVEVGQAIGDFASFKIAVKKYTASLHDHVIDDSDGKKEEKAHNQLLSISNKVLEEKMIKDFIENTFKARPDMIMGVLDTFKNNPRSGDFIQNLYNKTETLESLYERAQAVKLASLEKAAKKNTDSPETNVDKDRAGKEVKALSGTIINNSDSDDDLQMEEDAKVNHLSVQAEQKSSSKQPLDASSIKELPNNKDNRNNKTISADEQLEKMADVKQSEMAASAFGQGSNTAKEMAGFQKKRLAVSVGARGYNVKNKAIETKSEKQDTNFSKTGYTR